MVLMSNKMKQDSDVRILLEVFQSMICRDTYRQKNMDYIHCSNLALNKKMSRCLQQ